MAVDSSRVRIRRELPSDALERAMAEDVRNGLGSDPKTLPPKYFYDARGSRLFQEITRLPEYYLTRAERAILERRADAIVADIEPRAVVEFGSGSAGKTEILLEALDRRGLLKGYGPIDVSAEPVREVAERLSRRFESIEVEGVVADFEGDVELPFEEERRLVLFLGSTIGNFEWTQAARFVRRVGLHLGSDDGLLIGFDLVKDRETLEAAYNDAAGVTAGFNRNVLRVLNHHLDGDLPVEDFRHRATWHPDRERIEMHLVAERAIEARLRTLDLDVRLEEGESIRTELSHKYTRESAGRLLSEGGLRLERWDTDPDGLFALALARP